MVFISFFSVHFAYSVNSSKSAREVRFVEVKMRQLPDFLIASVPSPEINTSRLVQFEDLVQKNILALAIIEI